MINTLYLPELREMLDQGHTAELCEFCNILHHPLRAAEFMEGLDAHEAWQVLKHADSAQRLEIFGYSTLITWLLSALYLFSLRVLIVMQN